jgi:hypothetical protein
MTSRSARRSTQPRSPWRGDAVSGVDCGFAGAPVSHPSRQEVGFVAPVDRGDTTTGAQQGRAAHALVCELCSNGWTRSRAWARAWAWVLTHPFPNRATKCPQLRTQPWWKNVPLTPPSLCHEVRGRGRGLLGAPAWTEHRRRRRRARARVGACPARCAGPLGSPPGVRDVQRPPEPRRQRQQSHRRAAQERQVHASNARRVCVPQRRAAFARRRRAAGRWPRAPRSLKRKWESYVECAAPSSRQRERTRRLFEDSASTQPHCVCDRSNVWRGKAM